MELAAQPKIRLYSFNNSPHTEYFKMAEKEARKSPLGIKHGAVIIDPEGKLMITGHNDRTTGNQYFDDLYFSRYPGRTIHAEISAFAKIPNENVTKILELESVEIKGWRIYSFRMTKGGSPASSRPCKEICWQISASQGLLDAFYIIKIDGAPFIAHEYF